jgi:HEPN domain-containing protein
MDKQRRIVAEGWLETASTQLYTAKKHLQDRVHYAEAVQAAQACVELSVKAILLVVGIDFAKSHGWDHEQLKKIAESIHKKQLLETLAGPNLQIHLPRLLFLVNFWEQFYLQAKYGMETGYLASAHELFGREEAELAAYHADECYRAGSKFRWMTDERLDELLK